MRCLLALRRRRTSCRRRVTGWENRRTPFGEGPRRIPVARMRMRMLTLLSAQPLSSQPTSQMVSQMHLGFRLLKRSSNISSGP